LSRKADIVIPVFADVEVTRACLESIFRHASPELGRVIVIDDASPDPAMQPMLQSLCADHPEILLLRNEENLGFVRSANRGIALRQHDVVLLNSDTLVTHGWLMETLEVAYSSDRIGSVVPLSNNGAFCSVPDYCQAADAHQLLDRDLKLDRLPRWTVLPTAVGFCLLMKHTALNMVGAFDQAFGRGYNEENDWCMRAQSMGLDAVRANRAMVYHLGAVSFGDERAELNARTARLLVNRFPYFTPQVNAFSSTAESRVPSQYVKHRLGRLSAALNVRAARLEQADAGGSDAFALAMALRQHTDIQISAFGALPEHGAVLNQPGIPRLTSNQLEEIQIFHQPGLLSLDDLNIFLSVTSQTVISDLDLIAWRTPSAHGSFDDFERYRASCFAAAQSAQAIIAPSNYAKSEISSELHVSSDRIRTIYPGIDAARFEQRDQMWNRIQIENRGVRGLYFLYLGPDAAHKNLKLLLASYALFRHRFQGPGESPSLVLIGRPSGTLGSLYGLGSDIWPVGVHYLGDLTADECRAFLQESLALVHPAAHEPFGRTVLEAMAAGTPAICAKSGALPETAHDAALYIEEFSIEEVARLMASVASSAALRLQLIERGRERVKSFTWKTAAMDTAQLYREVVDRPSVESLFQRRMFATLLRSAKSDTKSSLPEEGVALSSGNGSGAWDFEKIRRRLLTWRARS